MKLTAELNLIGHPTRSRTESDRPLICLHPSKPYATNAAEDAPRNRLCIHQMPSVVCQLTWSPRGCGLRTIELLQACIDAGRLKTGIGIVDPQMNGSNSILTLPRSDVRCHYSDSLTSSPRFQGRLILPDRTSFSCRSHADDHALSAQSFAITSRLSWLRNNVQVLSSRYREARRTAWSLCIASCANHSAA